MKPKRLLNIGGIGLMKGKIRNSLTSLSKAGDEVEKLLDENTFLNKPFSAILVLIYYADTTEILPPSFPLFKKIKDEFLEVEIGLEMKKLQVAAKESKLTEVFTWALLETLNNISNKYKLPINELDLELLKYQKTRNDFLAETV